MEQQETKERKIQWQCNVNISVTTVCYGLGHVKSTQQRLCMNFAYVRAALRAIK